MIFDRDRRQSHSPGPDGIARLGDFDEFKGPRRQCLRSPEYNAAAEGIGAKAVRDNPFLSQASRSRVARQLEGNQPTPEADEG